MVFSSTFFLFLFLPIVLLLSIASPRRYRNAVLFLSSVFFYFWSENWFIGVLLGSALIDFICGLVISGAWRGQGEIASLKKNGPRTRAQRTALIISIITNLSVLGFFKYTNFAINNYNMLMGILGLDGMQWDVMVKVILPLGISFYTFQSMSYTFDIYLGNTRATRNILDYLTYIIMFPQLVAGPIIRYRDVARQLTDRTITREKYAYGIRRFVVGLGKKVLFANTLAFPVNQIFDIPFSELTPSLCWLGLFLFSLQIYYDFSGYSDMAIGLGSMLGFHFKENFRHPFISASGTEYFQRWHSSLNSWLRDYPYRAMGGSRGPALKVYFNLVFLLVMVGFWHGANWNFIFWGLLCGFYLAVQRFMVRSGKKTNVWHWVKVLFCFFLFMQSMAFFRATSLTRAIVFMKGLYGLAGGSGIQYHVGLYLSPKIILFMIVGYFFSLPLAPWIGQKHAEIRERYSGITVYFIDGFFYSARTIGVFLILAASAIALASQSHNPFIYFRF